MSTTTDDQKVNEEVNASSTSLLPLNIELSITPSSKRYTNNIIIFITLIFAIGASLTFAVILLRSSSSPLRKLKTPVVLLVSSDGFRFGYNLKTSTPNIDRLIKQGTEAEQGLIPVFPTLTFPNHYSIVTGLYPAYHGIVNNHFIDPKTNESFSMGSHDPKWWLGEPIWETVTNHGFKSATYFWPGSEVKKGSWNCSSEYCQRYNKTVPFDDRIDHILRYFDEENDEIPVFMTLYFEDPDHQGHEVGPDDQEITESISRIDYAIGRLINGLEKRGLFDDVNLILVGDHGMVSTCEHKVVALNDITSWINIPKDWVQSYSPLLSIRPQPNLTADGHNLSDIVSKMNNALKSGEVLNGKRLKMYLKEDLPGRLHYTESDRIPAIIGLIDEGFKVVETRSDWKKCGGSHGYDNDVFSMRSIFIGHGPRFARGRKVSSFENVEIYNVITSILGINGARNNGTSSFPDSILLPNSS